VTSAASDRYDVIEVPIHRIETEATVGAGALVADEDRVAAEPLDGDLPTAAAPNVRSLDVLPPRRLGIGDSPRL
jgi:hypothetical protein